eukprot:CAMPEP_0197671770 /NCGR_PEP_ID=MMETSP1338-20131121/77407_1 /TAXON_ID=43686 ORGANISM="Pelagodinium beii, Strain RCC1491" /NCGR_SAMPLE_ID=MMETSP1338 /ASSEMBLY_ACC=CAM_ASM_000754 /LENGTH=43 /DNA_ID= /DNA_START= /DNA_END= /DNA_ORIENTATION=
MTSATLSDFSRSSWLITSLRTTLPDPNMPSLPSSFGEFDDDIS